MEGTVLNLDGSLGQNVQLLQLQDAIGPGATIHTGAVTRPLSTGPRDQSGVAETLLNIGQPGMFVVNDKTVQLQLSNDQLEQVMQSHQASNTGEVIFTDAQGQIITTTEGHGQIISNVGALAAQGHILSTSEGQGHIIGEVGALAAHGQIITTVQGQGEIIPAVEEQLSLQEQITGSLSGQFAPQCHIIGNGDSEIGTPGLITGEFGGQLANQQVAMVDENAGSVGVADGELKMEEDTHRIADDIRNQIGELCAQLADIGEESFLVSVRVRDATSEHLGSVKGDHFCLLRQELLQDFTNFCLGIDSVGSDEDDDFPELSLGNGTDDLDDKNKENVESENESMEVDDEKPSPPVKRAAPTTPRIIVMKKGQDGKGITVDHQYTGQGRPKRAAAAGVATAVATLKSKTQNKAGNIGKLSGAGGVDIAINTVKDNENLTTNILFLCDVCKGVFPDLKELREHKKENHSMDDHHCSKCTRVFSQKKTFERHLADAHSSEDAEALCDSCIMEFDTKESLENHISVYHDSNHPMKCDVCEQTFPNLNTMMDHRKAHFDYDCFCTKCWQGFFDYLELETHIQTDCRYKEALYKCDICGKKYTKLHGINKHIDTHPIQSPYLCRMCGRGFDCEKDLKVHRIAAHIVRPYKCEVCQKTFKRKETLIEHRRIHLKQDTPMHALKTEGLDDETEPIENKLECPICGIVLLTDLQLEQHLNLHSESKEEHTCDYCDKTFFTRSLLIVHCRKEHKIFLQPTLLTDPLTNLIECGWEGCQKQFDDRTKFKYHMKYHQNRADRVSRGQSLTPVADECQCPLCGKVLKYKSYLKLHMMMHSGERPYTCDICGQSYTSSRRLADHIRVHKNERPFKCKVCEKHFTSTSLRNQHMVVHWGHKKYICDVCGKGFMSRKHFHDHMRIHNGETPHQCETCGKDFIYYRSLIRHTLTHIDPKERPRPYKCTYCGKEYTEVTGYKHHIRSVHTGENPFQCELCGDAFHRNDKLKRHMKSRHNKRDDEIDKMRLQRIQTTPMTHIVTTRRSSQGGPPMIVKTESEPQVQNLNLQGGELRIIQPGELQGDTSEIHVDVIQENSPQVFLIGLGNDGNDSAYLQETQIIEGADGVRYIIAGSGEELQVIESSDIQQFQDGEIIQGNVEQLVDGGAGQVIQEVGGDEVGMIVEPTVQFIDDQETLNTLANMASVAEVADTV